MARDPGSARHAVKSRTAVGAGGFTSREYELTAHAQFVVEKAECRIVAISGMVAPRITVAGVSMLQDHDGPTEVLAVTGRRRRGAWIAVAVVAAVLLGAGGIVLDALCMPGDDPVVAKLAEWGRDHGLGPVVTWLEKLQYERDQPAVGGAPAGGIPPADGVRPGVAG